MERTPLMLGAGGSARANIANLGRLMRPIWGLGYKYWPQIKHAAESLIRMGGAILSEDHINTALKEDGKVAGSSVTPETQSGGDGALATSAPDSINDRKNRPNLDNKSNKGGRKRKKKCPKNATLPKQRKKRGGKLTTKKRKIKVATIFD